MENKDKIFKYLEISPVLTNKHTVDDFPNAFILNANIDSADLGIVNTANGLKKPKWFEIVNTFKKEYIIIDKLDSISIYEQEKFYELLNYNTISGVEFTLPIKFIITYSNLDNINTNIKSLCRVIK